MHSSGRLLKKRSTLTERIRPRSAVSNVADAALTLDLIRRVVREELSGPRPLMAIADVARVLNVSTRTVETLLAEGQLPRYVKVGRQRRWHPDAIDAYIRGLNEN